MKKSLLLLLFAFILFACSSSNEPCAIETLTIQNSHNENYNIVRVSLVGYNFTNIEIQEGDSQTFQLIDGLIGGTDNIQVTISYSPLSGRPAYRKDETVNFSDCSETKVIFQ